MELPAPATNAEGIPPVEGLAPGSDAPEQQVGLGAEQPGSHQAADPAGPLPAPTTAHATPLTPDPALAVPVAAGSTPPIADDGDLIEKEWVLKAKHIVEQTKHDPHQQNKAVNRVKADYLKKRYRKDIKLTDD